MELHWYETGMGENQLQGGSCASIGRLLLSETNSFWMTVWRLLDFHVLFLWKQPFFSGVKISGLCLDYLKQVLYLSSFFYIICWNIFFMNSERVDMFVWINPLGFLLLFILIKSKGSDLFDQRSLSVNKVRTQKPLSNDLLSCLVVQ